jgi:hypothetical protein
MGSNLRLALKIVLRYAYDMTNYYRNFHKIVRQATLAQVEEATLWYADAEKIALQVADNLNTTLEVGASVVSAFSPRERWSANVAKAIAFSLGQDVKGLSNNIKMARESLTKGFEALNGQKTNAFARAIAGDESAVVIDVWMMKAAKAKTNSPTKIQYFLMTQDIEKLAFRYGLSPRTTQALIWIAVRGGSQ